MNAVDQIVYRAPLGPTGMIQPVAASLQETSESDRWLKQLRPWLQAGGPLGRGYLNFGSQAALIRWKADATSGYAWQLAHVLVGQASVLSASYALQQPLELPPGLFRRLSPVAVDSAIRPGSNDIEARARSNDAIELLVPLLSRILAGEQSVTMPWTAPGTPELVLWGLLDVLGALGDHRPISFLSYAFDQPAAPAGLFVSFRQGRAAPPADPNFQRPARGLAASYADVGPAGLQRLLEQHRILEPADLASRIERLPDLWPSPEQRGGSPQTVNARAGSGRSGTGYPSGPLPATAPSPLTPPPGPARPRIAEPSIAGPGIARPGVAGPAGAGTGGAGTDATKVICPVCLSELDWGELPLLRWDSERHDYVEIEIPAGASPQQRAHLERGAQVRCPDNSHFMPDVHHLPFDYGRFGRPVVLGFIGMTSSGKSHLLTAMVGEIERDGLLEYGIGSRPLDPGGHEGFLDERVRPLMENHQVLPGTPEGVTTFEHGFLIGWENGPERPVALFDVAGGELAKKADTKRFLEIADGLIFVIDPGQLNAGGLGDKTFAAVLDLVRSIPGRPPGQVSAAIVLNKADTIRFEDPVNFWLRADRKVLDAAEFERESADVYAYLYSRDATVWARRPYQQCARATLHFASPTGGARQPDDDTQVFPRGVTPRRVLRPLVAMLAMTGVLAGAEAGRVGT